MTGYPRRVSSPAPQDRATPTGRPGPAWAVAGLLTALSLTGCVTRTVDDVFYEDSTVAVYLRQQTRGGEPIDRGFSHPAIISPDRLAHILALIDVKTGDRTVEERTAAVATSLLEPVSEALSEALRKADPSQQVVVLAIARERRLGVFTRKFLTSFVAFVKDDDLFLDFSRIDWEIPKQREDRLPRPELGEHPMDFRLASSQAMRRPGPQTLAVDWRNDLFSQPLGMRSDRGEIRRRTVLIDSPGAKAAEPEEPTPLPPGLSAQDLRDLADLEEKRRSGEVTEDQYNEQRDAILKRAD